MSKNQKYIDQFDRHAGSPAEFDSLFSFEGKELTAKRRIMMTGKKRSLAAASVAAAAVLTAAAGITVLNSMSITTGMRENSGGYTEVTSYADMSSYRSSGTVELSHIIGHFDYTVNSSDINSTVSDISLIRDLDADIYVLAQTITKNASTKTDENGETVALTEYIIHPVGSFIDGANELKSLESFMDNEFIYFSAPSSEPSGYNELQPGCRYIIALNMETDGSYTLSDSLAMPVRQTDYGWLMAESEVLTDNTEPVYQDIDGYYPHDELVLADIGSEMTFAVEDIANEGGKSLRYFETEDNTQPMELSDAFSGISPYKLFEAVEFDALPDGSTDHSTIILRNHDFFELYPNIAGTVSYVGTNLQGENMVVITPDDVRFSNVIFTGLKTVNVNEGDIIDNSTLLGECSDEPVYCRFIDHLGYPAVFKE